jgi:hypothetical protein
VRGPLRLLARVLVIAYLIVAPLISAFQSFSAASIVVSGPVMRANTRPPPGA